MSEKKQQNLFVPLRVRFRSLAEQAQWKKVHAAPMLPSYPSIDDNDALEPPIIPLPKGTESAQRTQQIKELIRLGNVLRAESGLNEVLQQVVASISTCTGFSMAVINLVEDNSDKTSPVAFAGGLEEGNRLISENPLTVEQMHRLMRMEFRISQSYFIPHQYADLYADVVGSVDKSVDDYEPGGWHPEDLLIVPLFSPRQKKLLGVLSLDDPEDGRIPTVESMEMIELFANQAAIAIDSARIFQEREAERVALEEAIVLLRRDLEQVQRGNLRVRVQSSHEKLQPVVEAMNIMIKEISEILGSVQMVTQAVDEHAQDVQRSSEILVRDTAQQERQVEHISHIVDEMAHTLKHVTEHAETVSFVARDASDVTTEGQNKVVRATDGMRHVRETTMHSARIMKRLGESGQEINDTVMEITDLTTRMNLLALNAAIEAVRAGEQGQGFADRAQAVRGQSLRHACLDGGKDSALDARVAGHPVEPASQRGERLVLGEQGWRRRHELVDVLPVDLGEQVLAGREVPVEGALADACLPGDRVELHLARVRDGRPRGRDDPGAVARGVGPEAGRVHRSPARRLAKRTRVR